MNDDARRSLSAHRATHARSDHDGNLSKAAESRAFRMSQGVRKAVMLPTREAMPRYRHRDAHAHLRA